MIINPEIAKLIITSLLIMTILLHISIRILILSESHHIGQNGYKIILIISIILIILLILIITLKMLQNCPETSQMRPCPLLAGSCKQVMII